MTSGKNTTWYSFVSASRQMGKSPQYLATWFRRHNDAVPEGIIFKSESAYFINDEGIAWVKSHTKKEDVRLNTQLFKRQNTRVTARV